MAGKSLDPQVVTSAVLELMREILSKITGMVQTQEPETKESEIVDYEGRMRVLGVEKFNATSYVAVINFYLNERDMQKRSGTKGALVLYLDSENAGKLFKGLSIPFDEDEDDGSMLNACSQFAKLIGEAFKQRLTASGYSNLFMSEPDSFKNSLLEGVEFSPDQTTKQEFSFFYLKRKTIVVEVTFADIPKGR